MDGPRLSIFQGSDLKFSNTFQRAEEDEFFEEGRKREAELKDLFQDAFDDLNDDDDDASSLASSHLSVNHSDAEFKGHPLQNFNFGSLADFRELPMFNQQRKEHSLDTISEKHDETNDSMHFQHHHSLKNTQNKVDTDISGQHHTHCFKNGPVRERDVEKDLMESYKKTEGGGYDELKVLYEVRMREVERLRREVDIEREAKEEVIHQFALSQSEKNNALVETSEYKQLLSKSKDRISELEDTVGKMKLEILQLEKAREKDEEEVKISHQQVICLEQKIAAMERCDVSSNRVKQMDAFVENLSSKHQKELNILQMKVDSITAKLEQKETECRGLETKLDELERKRAALVLEKCDGASRQENALQGLLNKANEEKVELNRHIVSLQSECANLKSELDQYESVAKLRLCLGSSSDESPEFGRGGPLLARTKSASSIAKSYVNPHHQDLINNLRDELHRALLAKAAKRHEINKLQEHVRSKELQIQDMKERERVYLSQADSLKADITKIVGQLTENRDTLKEPAVEEMKFEIDRLIQINQQHLNTIKNLNVEIERLKQDLKSEYSSKVKQGEEFIGLRENEIAHLKSQAEELLKANVNEWKDKLEMAMKECDEIKQLYMDLRRSRGQLGDQLELQKQQLSLLTQEKDQILSALKEKEIFIDRLKEENIKYKLEKEMNWKGQESNAQDINTIRILELEVDRLRIELVELPKKQTKELEGLKNELEGAKFRLIELDKRLRKEFQTEVSTIIAERDQLKELMKNQETVVNRADGGPSQLQDIGVVTDPERNIAIIQLKEEIERLSALKNGDSSNLEDIYRKRIETELENLEKRLVSEHKSELAASEERIKSVMVTYYSNQIDQIKQHFEAELAKLIAIEQKKVSELTQVLAQNEAEIRQLKSSDSSEKLVLFQKRIDEDRQKFSDALKQWSNQVDTLKTKISDDENKIKFLNQTLKHERKDNQKYKVKLDNARKRIEQEKLENMIKIKSHIDNLMDAVNLDEKNMNDKVNQLELAFSVKEEELQREVISRRSK